MDRTACTEPQCLFKGALYLYLTETCWRHTKFQLQLEQLWTLDIKMYVCFCAHLMYNSGNICWQQKLFLTKLAEKNLQGIILTYIRLLFHYLGGHVRAVTLFSSYKPTESARYSVTGSACRYFEPRASQVCSDVHRTRPVRKCRVVNNSYS
jgi:hypothetical protein